MCRYSRRDHAKRKRIPAASAAARSGRWKAPLHAQQLIVPAHCRSDGVGNHYLPRGALPWRFRYTQRCYDRNGAEPQEPRRDIVPHRRESLHRNAAGSRPGRVRRLKRWRARRLAGGRTDPGAGPVRRAGAGSARTRFDDCALGSGLQVRSASERYTGADHALRERVRRSLKNYRMSRISPSSSPEER